MQQLIKRERLRPGMYVVSHGLGTFDKPLVRVDKPILTQADIALLVPEDVEDITIDTSVDISPLGQRRAPGAPLQPLPEPVAEDRPPGPTLARARRLPRMESVGRRA